MDWQREMCGEVCRMNDRIAVVDDAGGWDVFDLSMNRLGGGQEADIEAAKGKCESWQKSAQASDYDWVDITNNGGPEDIAKATMRDKLPIFVECAEAGDGFVCLYEYSDGFWGWMFEDDSYGGDTVPKVSSGGFSSRESALADFEFVREHTQEELHFPNYGPHWGSKSASSFDDDVYGGVEKYPCFSWSPAGGAISYMSELQNGNVLEVWSSDDNHGWVLYDDNGSVLRENTLVGKEHDAEALIESMCDDFFGLNTSAIAKQSQNFANSPRVPEEVDSKDDQPCPLCGSDHYDGKHCQTCGYDQSPDGLDDIDIDDLDEIEDVDSETGNSADTGDGADDANQSETKEEDGEQQVSAMAKSAEVETWWTPGARDRVSITTFDDGEISIDTNQPYVWGDYANAYHRRSMGDNEFDIRIDTDSAISPSRRHIKMMTSLVGPPHYDDIVEELLKMNESLRDTRRIDRT